MTRVGQVRRRRAAVRAARVVRCLVRRISRLLGTAPDGVAVARAEMGGEAGDFGRFRSRDRSDALGRERLDERDRVATGVAVATVAAPGVGSAGVGLRAAASSSPLALLIHRLALLIRTRARAIDDAVAAAARARARRARPPRTAPSARLPRRMRPPAIAQRWVGMRSQTGPTAKAARGTWATSPWASSPKPCSGGSTRRSRPLPDDAGPPVVGVQIAPDGAYAFAEMRTEKLSDAAMHLDGVELCSRAMRVGRPKGG